MMYQVVGWSDGRFLGLRGPEVKSYEAALEIATDPKHREYGVRWVVVDLG